MKGNTDAVLTRFLREIRSAALKYAQIRVGSDETALDIVQDTMMGFVNVVDRYDHEAWKNLFYKILNQRITDWLRKQSWRNKLINILFFSHFSNNDAEQQLSEPEFADHDNTVTNFQADRLVAQFEATLAKLPAQQQEAYLLRQ